MRIAALTLAVLLTGCAATTTVPIPANPAIALNGNWQLQSANTATGASNVLFVGALANTGTKVTGTFRMSTLTAGGFCGTLNQVVTATGTLDTANPLLQTLTLTAALPNGGAMTAVILFSSTVTGTGSGTIQVTGGSCPITSTQGLALEYANVNGTYTGALTPTGSAVAGLASLAVTQASTANSDGQFAVTGTLTYTGQGCTTSTALTGTVSGPIVTLLSSVNPLTATSFVTFGAVDSPISSPYANQLPQVNALYYPAPCSTSLGTTATYTGNLTRQ